MDNRSRLIVHDDAEIFILHKKSGQVEHMTYTPELYHVLCSPACSFSYDYRKGRIAIEVMTKQQNGQRWKNLLGRFVYLWMNNDRPSDEFLSDMPIARGTTVDHANGDKQNHCFWNLSGISRNDNSRKADYAERIRPPYYCYTVVDDSEKYRVCFGYANLWKQGQELNFLCDDIDALISLFKAIMEIEDAPAFLNRGQTPFRLWKADKHGMTFAEDWKKARKYAASLLEMPESTFDHWSDDSKIVARLPIVFVEK